MCDCIDKLIKRGSVKIKDYTELNLVKRSYLAYIVRCVRDGTVLVDVERIYYCPMCGEELESDEETSTD